ncbi:hypothetical protein NJB14197_30380 [Mycobacterium montefiorense]|uniref:Uncharacterized protein n=1 Tax=Mycobacterium montefiorense TaxID=154654 RepID=A0AA37PLJ3_9MYCO|nr:hypothetical protein MmonteBS_03760 [Mycobacterium montefiorense]GKU34004.1 hypothetical protein NJB14191_13500 [Mycobacterium montefiorense]GKU41402.1 hypothetical protein NJB14192_33860 [Mycobacterium montefiorense]GKU47500.1 hypothetical protein NJB14194_41180 [Mycobacterium montefiorense]GKU57178.1 hypothetical protein NJB14197_30380 [Mycobacterium montefiorense]
MSRITLAGPITEQREIRERVTDFPDSLRDSEFPYPPTLLEIAQRRHEIDVWQALQVGGYRFAKPGFIISFLVSAVLMFLALTPIPPNWPWNIPLVIGAVFGAVTMVVCGLLWLDTPKAAPRPQRLVIVPFSRAENLHLMTRQPVEPYRATCACPGCGDLSTHLVRQPGQGEPQSSTVTRHCRVCGREWAQS